MGDLITLSCPSCGGKLEVNTNTSLMKCPYCGVEIMVRQERGALSLEAYARCPKCGRNDRVEKVTAILRSQPEGSGLAKSLTPPVRPAVTSKPQTLPRPELTPKPAKKPRPKLNPKPEITPHPMDKYKKKNYWFLIGGLVLFIISYLNFFIFLGMSFDISGEGYLICSTISLIPLVLSVFLIIKGYTWKKSSFDNINSLKEYLHKRQKDPEKQKTKFIVISTVFFVFATIFLIFSLLIFNDDIGGSIFLLGFSSLLAIFGFYFLVKLRSVKKQDSIEHPSNDEFNLALEKWEEENQRIQNNWSQENSRLINEWEEENAEIIKRWEPENSRLMENWEKENNRRLEEWQEKNMQIPQRYRDVMERWEELYFCHRDDVVFIPGEGTYAPIENMNDYLQN